MLDLSLIRIDGGTQSRVELNQETVAEYAEAYKAGALFPPVIVFFDGADRWLADGFHRYFGAKAAGVVQIFEEVIPGTKRDAVLYSLKANATHGLKRTNADKRKAVETILKDAEWSAWSDRKIAELIGVSVSFIGATRRPEVAEKQQANKTASAVRQVEKCSPTTPTTNPAETVNPPKAKEETREPVEDYGPDDAELAANAAATAADMLAMEKLFDADDKLSAAFAEIKRLNAELAQVKVARDGYMNKSNELITMVKKLQRQLDRAAP